LLKNFYDFCGFDAVKLIESYATKKINRKSRQVPNDDKVVEGFYKIGVQTTLNVRKCL
jgi:hypothetical protein